MNTPSNPAGNWTWRLLARGALHPDFAARLAALTGDDRPRWLRGTDQGSRSRQAHGRGLRDAEPGAGLDRLDWRIKQAIPANRYDLHAHCQERRCHFPAKQYGP